MGVHAGSETSRVKADGFAFKDRRRRAGSRCDRGERDGLRECHGPITAGRWRAAHDRTHEESGPLHGTVADGGSSRNSSPNCVACAAGVTTRGDGPLRESGGWLCPVVVERARRLGGAGHASRSSTSGYRAIRRGRVWRPRRIHDHGGHSRRPHPPMRIGLLQRDHGDIVGRAGSCPRDESVLREHRPGGSQRDTIGRRTSPNQGSALRRPQLGPTALHLRLCVS